MDTWARPGRHRQRVLERDPGPAFTGEQPARCIVGPLSRALKMAYGRSVSTFGVRFHPAKGAAFLGQRATKLQDTLLPVADRDLKARGVTFESEPDVMPFGTGVMMQDLYGNKSYLNQDAA